jgi:hypothetical protein
LGLADDLLFTGSSVEERGGEGGGKRGRQKGTSCVRRGKKPETEKAGTPAVTGQCPHSGGGCSFWAPHKSQEVRVTTESLGSGLPGSPFTPEHMKALREMEGHGPFCHSSSALRSGRVTVTYDSVSASPARGTLSWVLLLLLLSKGSLAPSSKFSSLLSFPSSDLFSMVAREQRHGGQASDSLE